ncbi:MAG: DUF3035 domain-containing protein [Henriciella sp.]|nr:DUF3035 domain-containing protein [Henriciella sp.]
MKKTMILLAAGGALASVAGCASLSGPPNTPDEFRVVKKAPLVVPPDYSLRPPSSGQAQPIELDPSRTEATTAFGASVGQDASASERALVAAAGANAVSSVVRTQVDYEEARVIRKSQSAMDRIMFWSRTDEPYPVEDSATGGEEVMIERGSGTSRLKLPGT